MIIFHNARVKLTTWYLAIIMCVSLSFSFFVYRNVIGEVDRGFRIRSLRTSFVTPVYLIDDQQMYQDIRRRIITQLAFVNGLIFVMSAAAGYFLAGKTLRPIEQVMEDQKRFIGDASHELRTPLTSIKTEIEVNLRDKALTLKDAKMLLESNLEEVNKMQVLSNYLLSLTRYEDGEKALTKSTVHLNKVVTKVIEQLSAHIKQKEIVLKNTVPDVNIYANETSIAELVSILIDNAIKYSAKGGSVGVKAKVLKRTVAISIIDEGIGIKSTDLPYIFNRFYRADISRTKEKVEGYGLGLSIAKSIVEMHNGTIVAKSQIGKGSTFTVTLPRS